MRLYGRPLTERAGLCFIGFGFSVIAVLPDFGFGGVASAAAGIAGSVLYFLSGVRHRAGHGADEPSLATPI
jgi:uncharacterized membrane protein YtjA (UPF0391 family)